MDQELRGTRSGNLAALTKIEPSSRRIWQAGLYLLWVAAVSGLFLLYLVFGTPGFPHVSLFLLTVTLAACPPWILHLRDGQQRRHKLRRMVESLTRFPNENPNPVLRVALDGRVLYANGASLALRESLTSADGASILEPWLSLVADSHNSTVIRESELACGDRVFLLVVAPVPNEDELNLYALDITERERTKEQLIAARREAEESARAKASFLANMSHEIRTPMTGVLGMTELLLITDLNSEQRELAATAHSSAHSLLTVINDILDFSKIEAGRMDLDCTPFDMREISEDLVRLMTPQATSRGTEVRMQYGELTPTRFAGDPGRIRQILGNVVGNAIKFTEDGLVVIDVGSRLLSDERTELHISVEDNGIGISAENQERIFGEFTQADASTTRQFGGTGLGLTITRSLVRMMGGQISVSSRLGVGTKISIAIPLTTVAENTVAPVSPRQYSAADRQAAPEFAGQCILVVDDNRVNRAVALRMLETLGCQGIVAADGREAVELHETHKVDAILMDCEMPGMDGYEATREIRRRESADSHTPIIAITAHAMAGEREKCLLSGMDDYLAKPLSLISLEGALRRWLAGGAGTGRAEADRLALQERS